MDEEGKLRVVGGVTTGYPGRVDIVNKTFREGFEIKNEKKQEEGRLEILWYVLTYNALPQDQKDPLLPVMTPGRISYTIEWEYIGPNPYSYGSQALLAKLGAPGVVVYRGVPFKVVNAFDIREEDREYYFEYNQWTGKVERRKRRPGPLEWNPYEYHYDELGVVGRDILGFCDTQDDPMNLDEFLRYLVLWLIRP